MNTSFATSRNTASSVSTTSPTISVIVPIRNEEAHIESTLNQLLAQDCDGLNIEILVADGRSTDSTREIVQRLADQHPQIRLFDNPDKLSSAARNVCIQNSTGDVVLIVDGHCEIPNRAMLRNVSDAFTSSGADCLGRPQLLDVTGATTLQKAIASARESRLGHHPESFIYSGQPQFSPAKSVAVAYRRELFDQVGFFDETFDAHEDGELNYRVDQAGMKCWFTPDIAVQYHPRGNLRGLFKQMTRYGRGRVRLHRKHTESLSISSILPALFLIGLVIGPPVCWLLPILWPVYLGVITLYITILFAFAITTAIRDRQPAYLLLLPIVYATIHIASGWGVIREFLRFKHQAERT